MLPRAATDHYRDQQRLAVVTLVAARRVWAQVQADDFEGSWRFAGPRLLTLLAAAQERAARDGAVYVGDVLAEQGIDADPAGEVRAAAFAGHSSAGMPLEDTLHAPVRQAKQWVADGATGTQALAHAKTLLEGIVLTQVADAARNGAGAGMVARPGVDGFARMLNPPSCSRCAILAGKFYRWNTGFERHPRCDCRHVPTREDVAGDLTTDPQAYFDSLSAAEQDRVFTKAGAQAVRDGADMGQVVNARRGARGLSAPGRLTREEQRMLRGGRGRGQLERVDVYGRPVYVTTEGTTRRGLAGQRLAERGGYAEESAGRVTRITRTGPELRDSTRRRAKTPRLMPESIYEIAEDREDAIRLLKRFGYIT